LGKERFSRDMTVPLSSFSRTGNGNATMRSGGPVDEKAPGGPCTSPAPPVELTSSHKEKQQSGYYHSIHFLYFDHF